MTLRYSARKKKQQRTHVRNNYARATIDLQISDVPNNPPDVTADPIERLSSAGLVASECFENMYFIDLLPEKKRSNKNQEETGRDQSEIKKANKARRFIKIKPYKHREIKV